MIRFLRWLGMAPKQNSEDPEENLVKEKDKIDFAVEALRAQANLMAQTARESDRMRREVLPR